MGSPTDVVNIIDLEATCWEGRQQPEDQEQEIIEIGIAVVDVPNHEVKTTEGILVQPEMSEVSEFCTELTSLTSEQLHQNGISFSDACKKLRKKYNTHRRPWGSWGNWDKKQFGQDCDMKNVKYPLNTTHFNVKTLFAVGHQMTNEVGLGKAVHRRWGEFDGQHHRGVDDARNIAKLFIDLFS